MKVWVKTVPVKKGPHAGKKMFWWQGKWHFIKWVSKKEIQSNPYKIYAEDID